MVGERGFFPIGSAARSSGAAFVTLLIIITNIIVFFLVPEQAALQYAFVPANPDAITLFTHMFLHADIFHLLGNMLFLWVFGKHVESVLGGRRFTILYFLSGIGAVFTHSIIDPSSTVPLVGASGAISGVLGAYILLFPKSKVRVYFGFFLSGEMPAVFYALFWFMLQIYFGIASLQQDAGIAFFAHIGGFITGLAFLPMLRPKPRRILLR